MPTRLPTILANAGVASDIAALLLPRVLSPTPGSIDTAELDGASDVQLALLSAVVAAAYLGDCGPALPPLLDAVSRGQASLSDYDNGRFWHLQGVAALRLDQDLDSATRACNRSLDFLQSDTPPVRAYRGRVHDTYGQLLQRQGLCSEAQREFELALQHRDPTDEDGTALTLGTLGRLCMELGDFASATEYLARNVNIVTRRTPGRADLRAQLFSYLGTCALERGGLKAARNFFQQSKRLARTSGDVAEELFACVGLGQRAVRGGRLATAQHQVRAAQRLLEATALSEGMTQALRGLLQHLVAQIHLAQQQPDAAIMAFAAAQQALAQATDESSRERARLLYSLAEAYRQRGAGTILAQ